MAAPQSEAHYQRMATAPVGPLILSMAVPAMATTLISSIYNLADTFFVGQIGTSATAAVGVVFSFSMVLMALGFWVGTGGSTLISTLLGAKKNEQANAVASTAFALSMLFGLLVAAVGFAGGDRLLYLLGATDTILPHARQYARFILLGAPFSAGSFVMAQGLRAEGKAKESMIGQISGGILNMLLDPLFIFAFRWGITGAAAATAISQLVNWSVMVSYYLRGKTQVKLHARYISRRAAEYRQLFTVGFPSLCRHGCNMIANVVLNTVAGGWGDAAIAAMSVCSRLMYLSNAVSMGMSQGSQPVIGFANGKGDARRVGEAFWFMVKVSTASMVAFAAVEGLFAAPLIGLFRNDPEVIRIGTVSLRLICLALPFANFMQNSSTLFQVTKHPGPSSLLLFLRQLLVYIPALLVLPRMLDLLGLQLAGPLADILVGCIAIPMVLRFFQTLGREAAKAAQ